MWEPKHGFVWLMPLINSPAGAVPQVEGSCCRFVSTNTIPCRERVGLVGGRKAAKRHLENRGQGLLSRGSGWQAQGLRGMHGLCAARFASQGLRAYGFRGLVESRGGRRALALISSMHANRVCPFAPPQSCVVAKNCKATNHTHE